MVLTINRYFSKNLWALIGFHGLTQQQNLLKYWCLRNIVAIIEYTIHVIQFRPDDKENNIGFSIAKNKEKKEWLIIKRNKYWSYLSPVLERQSCFFFLSDS